mmetsp:Transcript_80212/g.157354  ORF Transcript_80212/g.157354 Transcript_80212/m.157354 type:complete len:93 (+) Transcript_80212:592-870(+)
MDKKDPVFRSSPIVGFCTDSWEDLRGEDVLSADLRCSRSPLLFTDKLLPVRRNAGADGMFPSSNISAAVNCLCCEGILWLRGVPNALENDFR